MERYQTAVSNANNNESGQARAIAIGETAGKIRRNYRILAVFLMLATLWLWAVNPARALASSVDEDETEAVTEAAEDMEEADEDEAAAEDSSIVFSTNYPGVSMKPGDTSSFTLYMTNSSVEQADVSLSAELPDGWGGHFQGSSSEVSMVHVSSLQTKDDSPTLTYSLTVPDDAAEGDYEVMLTAGNEDVSASLTLQIKVTAEEYGSGAFTAEYPEQQGASGSSFSFTTTLTNNGGSDATYALSASAPEGWQVTFTSDSTQVTSVPIEALSSATVTVAVTPVQTVEKGDYDITVTAASATETLKLDLGVSITGTYAATLSTPTGNLSASAYAGEETTVTLSITNTGNVDLENLTLSGAASTDWTVEFDEDTIGTLEAGATKEVTARITPAEDSIIGDYVTEITMSNDEVSQVLDLRVSVKNHTTWGFAAVGIIAALIVILALIIRKYGRR